MSKGMDGLAKKLAKLTFRNCTNAHGTNYHESFEGWAQEMAKETDPDVGRNLLYYGFQPLFDACLEGHVRPKQQLAALQALAQIQRAGIDYLTSYYLGKPKMIILRRLGKALLKQKLLPDCDYITKRRNIDMNGITAAGIGSFLRQFCEWARDGEAPTHIVGCACGASEIVMPLAGMLGVPLSFIRRSFRRGDSEPRIIPMHKKVIQAACKGRRVLCVEDYVCSGTSLQKVMETVKEFGPSSVFGGSVNDSCEGSCLERVVSQHKFHLFQFRE